MDDKTVFYSILGIIGIVVLSGLVVGLAMSKSGMGVYSGGMNPYNPYPTERGRTPLGGVEQVAGYVYPQQAVDVSKTSPAYERTGYSIFHNRYPPRTHTALQTCGGQEALTRAGYETGVPYGYVLTLSLTEMYRTHGLEGDKYCVPAPQQEGMFCCKSRSYFR